jgi:hypothetical protein
LSREAILQLLRAQCLTLVLDTASLVEPLPVGSSKDLTTMLKLAFIVGEPEGTPLAMELVSEDASLGRAQGFTDASGKFETTVTALASARALGIVSIDAKACLILPTERAKGALANAPSSSISTTSRQAR